MPHILAHEDENIGTILDSIKSLYYSVCWVLLLLVNFNVVSQKRVDNSLNRHVDMLLMSGLRNQ